MQDVVVSDSELPTTALEWLLPLADRVGALARDTGRAFVEGNAELAESLIAADGVHAQLSTALRNAWAEILDEPDASMGAEVSLVTSLEHISDLAARICAETIELSDRPTIPPPPAIQRLAEMVPEMLGDALGALRENNANTAGAVLRQGLAVDACFAQTYLDLLDVAGGNFDRLELAQHFHAVTSAFERMGDGASDIADSVRTA